MFKEKSVSYCHQHNLVIKDKADTKRNFGIRVTLAAEDTFTRLIGKDWETTLWYVTEEEREQAFLWMSERHGYYRKTDSPTHILNRISR